MEAEEAEGTFRVKTMEGERGGHWEGAQEEVEVGLREAEALAHHIMCG